MPEIPELEAIRGFFDEHLAGRAIESVETRIPFIFRTPANELRETLPGDRFGRRSRGPHPGKEDASSWSPAGGPLR